jgi:hypothetical protein
MTNGVKVAFVAALLITHAQPSIAACQRAHSCLNNSQADDTTKIGRRAHAEVMRSGNYHKSDRPNSDISSRIVGPYYCGNDYFGGAEAACGLSK